MPKRSIASRGIGNYLWKISIALYLLTNGVLEVMKYHGDFYEIFERIGLNNEDFLMFIGIISLVAGVAVLCKMFHVQFPWLDTLIFIVAIAWLVCVIVELFGMMRTGFGTEAYLWNNLKGLSIHLLVLSSLLIASGKFN